MLLILYLFWQQWRQTALRSNLLLCSLQNNICLSYCLPYRFNRLMVALIVWNHLVFVSSFYLYLMRVFWLQCFLFKFHTFAPGSWLAPLVHLRVKGTVVVAQHWNNAGLKLSFSISHTITLVTLQTYNLEGTPTKVLAICIFCSSRQLTEKEANLSIVDHNV